MLQCMTVLGDVVEDPEICKVSNQAYPDAKTSNVVMFWCWCKNEGL